MQEDLFQIQRNCLRLMGHQQPKQKQQQLGSGSDGDGDGDGGDDGCSDGNNEKSQRFRKWQTMKYIPSLLLVISAQWPMMDYVIYHIDDLTLATAGLSIAFTNVLTVIKISTFLLYKREFMELTAEFETLFAQMLEPEAKRRLVAANGSAMKFVKLYFYSVSATGVYFMIGPVIKIVWAAVMQTPSVREQPMPMRFSLIEFESSPGYECCYIYTGLVTLAVIMYATAVDGYFVSFSTNLRAHFQALQYFIQTNAFLKPDALLQRDISFYIQYHVLLLKLSDRVRQVYKPILFGQFLMTSLQVCVIIYQLVTHVGMVMQMVVYCTFLSSILLQLLIYCYGGEMLKIESLMVGTAVQLSQWYNLPPKYRRMLCLVLQRSQREVIFKAGFYEASLANFMVILKAAVSYITLIQSIE